MSPHRRRDRDGSRKKSRPPAAAASNRLEDGECMIRISKMGSTGGADVEVEDNVRNGLGNFRFCATACCQRQRRRTTTTTIQQKQCHVCHRTRKRQTPPQPPLPNPRYQPNIYSLCQGNGTGPPTNPDTLRHPPHRRLYPSSQIPRIRYLPQPLPRQITICVSMCWY